MRKSLLGLMLAGLAPVWAADLLTSFVPSAVRSEFGRTSAVRFATALVELESGVLAHHLPHAMKNYQFAEPVWVIGYRTEIVDSTGGTPRENYLCHTFFGDQRVDQRPGAEMKAIYSDAFTPEVRLPDGYGIPLAADEPLHWMPMFNNRGDSPVRVAMKIEVTVIRGKDVSKPLKPLYSMLRSVEIPHLFFVPPGHDERRTSFQLPFDGQLHFLELTFIRTVCPSSSTTNPAANWCGRELARTAGIAR